MEISTQTRELVQLMGWTIHQYKLHVLETGCQWIERHCALTKYPEIAGYYKYNQVYWSWWHGHYETRNKRFLHDICPLEKKIIQAGSNHGRITQMGLVDCFIRTNDPERLDIEVSGVVSKLVFELQESFAEMTGMMFDQKTTML